MKQLLKEIAVISAGQSAPQGDSNYCDNGRPFVKAGNLPELIGGTKITDIQKVSEKVANKYRLKLYPKGTVLFAKSGMSCMKGYVYVLPCEAYVVSHLACIIPKSDISEYLGYYFKYKKPNQLVKDAAYPSISLCDIGNLEIDVKDFFTRKNIVTTLQQIELIIALRQQEIQKLDNLVKARFVELFYDKGYPVLKWNDVFNTTTGKLDSNAAVDSGEYPFFTCSKEVLRIDKYAFEQEALLLAGNNAAGKYDVKYYNGKFNAYQRTYVLGLKEDWSYRLFQYQLENKLVYLQQQSLGGLTKYLTLKILGELEFIIPPKDKQEEFELFVKQTDKSKAAVQKSLNKLQKLFDKLMQEYFG